MKKIGILFGMEAPALVAEISMKVDVENLEFVRLAGLDGMSRRRRRSSTPSRGLPKCRIYEERLSSTIRSEWTLGRNYALAHKRGLSTVILPHNAHPEERRRSSLSCGRSCLIMSASQRS